MQFCKSKLFVGITNNIWWFSLVASDHRSYEEVWFKVDGFFRCFKSFAKNIFCFLEFPWFVSSGNNKYTQTKQIDGCCCWSKNCGLQSVSGVLHVCWIVSLSREISTQGWSNTFGLHLVTGVLCLTWQSWLIIIIRDVENWSWLSIFDVIRTKWLGVHIPAPEKKKKDLIGVNGIGGRKSAILAQWWIAP